MQSVRLQQEHYFARGIDPLVPQLQTRIEELHNEAMQLSEYFNTTTKKLQSEIISSLPSWGDKKGLFINLKLQVRWHKAGDPSSTLRIEWIRSYWNKKTGRTGWETIDRGARLRGEDGQGITSPRQKYMYSLELLESYAHLWARPTLLEVETAAAGLRAEASAIAQMRKRLEEKGRSLMAWERTITNLQRKYYIDPIFPRNMPPPSPKAPSPRRKPDGPLQSTINLPERS